MKNNIPLNQKSHLDNPNRSSLKSDDQTVNKNKSASWLNQKNIKPNQNKVNVGSDNKRNR